MSVFGVILVCIVSYSDWIWSVSLHVQSECGKMRTRITPKTDTFNVVYLACQEIPLQGLDNYDNLTQILYLLGKKDDNIFKDRRDESARIIIFRMYCIFRKASNVLRVKVSTIRDQKFFSIMADEGADVSNIYRTILVSCKVCRLQFRPVRKFHWILRFKEWATWWGNDQESLHKPLLSNQKQLIVRDTR